MNDRNRKLNTYVAGGFVGAILGILAAFLINKSSESDEAGYKFSGKRLTNFTLGTVSLLWSLIDKEKKN